VNTEEAQAQDLSDRQCISTLVDHRGQPIPVLHIDYHCIVVNKPHNMLSVPAHSDHLGVSLFTQLLALFPEVRCVHRLDYETSGVMVFARGKKAERLLFEQFRNRVVEKKYWAICHQPPTTQLGEITLAIGKDDVSSPYQRTHALKRKAAKTLWHKMGYLNNLWFAELRPITGRTHQLRVHLSAIGSPIFGDPLYGPYPIAPRHTHYQRLYLHAAEIQFVHPVSQLHMHFTCLPADIADHLSAPLWQHFESHLVPSKPPEVLSFDT
jgi:tRNA pseudouridine32 synthase/23S rRNA pseudouridine746 synthase